jgi:hypothetical protein
MNWKLRAVLVALTAALALSLASSASPANRSLQITSPRSFQLTMTGVEFLTSMGGIRCDISMRKTVSSVFPKVEGTLIGKVIEVNFANCAGTEGVEVRAVRNLGASLENTTLWRLFYKSFAGTLPRISSLRIRIEHVQLLFEVRIVVALTCLYEGAIEEVANIVNGRFERLRNAREARRLTLTGAALNSFGCPREGELLADQWELAEEVTVRLL